MDHRITKRRPNAEFRSLGYWSLVQKPGDPDIAAYFAAANITSDSEKAAATTLITALKANGTWPQLDYLFLCSPTSLAAALINAKTAVSATNNGATHSSSGLDTGNTDHFYGTEVDFGQYANFDFHCSVYATAPNPSGGNGWVGYLNQQGRYNANIQVSNSSFNTPAQYGDSFTTAAVTPTGLYTPAGGMYLLNMDSSTTASFTINNGTPVTDTQTPVGISGMIATDNKFPIGCCYTGGTSIYGGGFSTIKAATVGRRLTTQQKSDLYDIILAYQTALGRN